MKNENRIIQKSLSLKDGKLTAMREVSHQTGEVYAMAIPLKIEKGDEPCGAQNGRHRYYFTPDQKVDTEWERLFKQAWYDHQGPADDLPTFGEVGQNYTPVMFLECAPANLEKRIETIKKARDRANEIYPKERSKALEFAEKNAEEKKKESEARESTAQKINEAWDRVSMD
ncbi:hypothetical protein QEH59_18275 [Coraliomargarita sp. SDUM461004]|uniref:Uncharacterized protein n=1 Tax=Thalassobacterium sedimentorum TaxID=3041258 RepID=A0ABU1AQ68_9BACT|nr:hypothetical protein [Coraliomargarita sp. SDUM461004]MDQ8196383.1 hypothetical protein [Coraliomargarita sp. SDUM461004]